MAHLAIRVKLLSCELRVLIERHLSYPLETETEVRKQD
jgi:hypothetical protein